MKKVLVIETGGTFATQSMDGIRSLENTVNGVYGYDAVKERIDKYDFEFEVIRPIYMLSENMTFEKINIMIDALNKVNFSKYEGIILTHGTDTMAYTANILSLIFGYKGIPIVIVGANHPIDMDISNGLSNFTSAIDFIFDNNIQGTYVIYKNHVGDIEVHLGSRIKQMGQVNDTYESFKNTIFGYMINGEFKISDKSPKIEEINNCKSTYGSDFKLSDKNVLMILPYVGLRYDLINLDNIDAVCCGVYHSGTVNTDDKERNYSINSLISKAEKLSIPIFIGEVESAADSYETSESLNQAMNLHIVYDTSIENLYVKLNLGLSKYKGEELLKYLSDDIFFEKVKISN